MAKISGEAVIDFQTSKRGYTIDYSDGTVILKP
jgi:hypothetical protein